MLVPPLSFGGDLNAEVNAMFNNLGAMGNYTAPGAFRGQAYNTYTGGSLYMRSPNRTYQLVQAAFPSASGGCGGIDIFGGSFSHISGAEFKNMLKNITSALPGVAFQLALKSVSPLLGSLSEYFQNIETLINNARIGSCEAAKGIVSSAAEAAGFNAQETCAKLAVEQGMETDVDAARMRCKSDRGYVLNSARTSADPNIQQQAPFVGNLTWQGLKKVSAIDDGTREFIMSMVGTIIYPADGAATGPLHVEPTITGISQLLYGQSDANNGAVNLQVLKCNNYTDCDIVTAPDNYSHVPFTKLVENLMISIATKIQDRTPIPNPSPEIGFVNQTSLPVWKMMSIGSTIPSLGMADAMIAEYRDVIAADYAYNFLDQNIRLAITALNENWRLDKEQQDGLAEVRNQAISRMALISQERQSAFAKKTSVASVIQGLEGLERELRANLPQHVMDMLGQGSYVSH